MPIEKRRVLDIYGRENRATFSGPVELADYIVSQSFLDAKSQLKGQERQRVRDLFSHNLRIEQLRNSLTAFREHQENVLIDPLHPLAKEDLNRVLSAYAKLTGYKLQTMPEPTYAQAFKLLDLANEHSKQLIMSAVGEDNAISLRKHVMRNSNITADILMNE